MPDDARTRSEWIATFAARLGVEAPSDEEVEVILDLAGVAAHGSERTAAPLACWLAGRVGVPLTDVLDVARDV